MRVLLERPQERRLRASKYVVAEDDLVPARDMKVATTQAGFTVSHRALLSDAGFDGYHSEGLCRYVVNTDPFSIECYFNDKLALVVNQRQLFNYESPSANGATRNASVAMDFSFNGKRKHSRRE